MQEQQEIPGQNDQEKLKEELLALQMKQSSGGKWTAEDRQKLFLLEHLVKETPIHFSLEERAALLKRQSVAGEGDNPPLTEAERKKLQQLNRMV